MRRTDLLAGRGMRAVGIVSAGVILLVHVVIGAALLPVRAQANRFFGAVFARADASLPSTEDVAYKTLLLVNPPFEPLAYYFPFTRDANGSPRPRSAHALATGASAIAVTRVDAQTLRIRPERGFLSSPADTMMRSTRRPLGLGTAAALDTMTVDVTALTADGRPAEAVFRFRTPLEDPSLSWHRWDTRRYVPFVLPSVGETVTLPAVDFGALFAADP